MTTAAEPAPAVVALPATEARLPAAEATAARPRPPRLLWMDPCRGLAIGLVVAYHTVGYLRALGALPMPGPDSGDLHGEAGVDAFLLLSGFGLAYSARPGAWYQFLGRRVWRLVPAYWVVLLGCWGFQVYRQAYAADPAVMWKDLAIHASCLHLVWGTPYTFSISSAMWFMGLIVPLYVAFTLVRPWVVKSTGGYAALAWAAGLAAVGGALLLQYTTAQGWGDGPRGHAPHRLPTFFLGAFVGLAWQRRESLDALMRRPITLLGLGVAVAGPVFRNYPQFGFYLVAGASFVLLGMGLASVGQRWAFARPMLALLTGLGLISYELYLCHQYVMVTLNEAFLTPWLKRRWPTLDGPTVGLVSVGLSLAAACWAAFGVRWAVAWRESRATWRATLPAVLATSVLLAGGVVAKAALTPSDKLRTIRFTVALPPTVTTPPAVGAEPVLGLGYAGAGDLVLLQHDGAGLARVGVDHWGAPTTFSDWVDVHTLAGPPWVIDVGRRGISVKAGPIELRSPYRPFNWRAKAKLGRNEAGFSSAPPFATSRVEMVH